MSLRTSWWIYRARLCSQKEVSRGASVGSPLSDSFRWLIRQ